MTTCKWAIGSPWFEKQQNMERSAPTDYCINHHRRNQIYLVTSKKDTHPTVGSGYFQGINVTITSSFPSVRGGDSSSANSLRVSAARVGHRVCLYFLAGEPPAVFTPRGTWRRSASPWTKPFVACSHGDNRCPVALADRPLIGSTHDVYSTTRRHQVRIWYPFRLTH